MGIKSPGPLPLSRKDPPDSEVGAAVMEEDLDQRSYHRPWLFLTAAQLKRMDDNICPHSPRNSVRLLVFDHK